MKKKIIFVVTLLLIAGLTFFLIFKLRSDDNSKIQNDEFYAVVRESYAGYALVKPLDEDVGYDILSVSVKNLKVGDIIRLKVKNIKEIYPPEAEVLEVEVLQTDKISDLDGNDTIIEEITTTKSAERVSNETTNKVTTTTKIISTTTKTTTKKNDNKSADDEVLAYFNNQVNTADDKSKGTLKSIFIKVVDFIFYDKDINGYYFKDLTASAKLKVISLALKLDAIIDKHFPGYKEELSSSYAKAKDSLITLYLNLTSEFCKNNDATCESAKNDFALLKESLNLSWDVISSLAKSGTTKIKEWYEIFSGK
ncbi:MAG: hypothetical protein DBY43_03010 [Clostridiaceae bacterium]|nr:MAG: hypothetical protein DBY43_03010 [Clostridiaceae bacterium]